jgi:hypothetical protein
VLFGKIQCLLLQQATEKAIKAVYQHKGLLEAYHALLLGGFK